MATERPGEKLAGHVSAADLSAAGQYLAATISAVRTIAVADGTTDVVVGIIQNDPVAGQSIEVMTTGESKAVSGAAIAVGVEVEVNAAGKFITLSAGTKVGVCLLAAGGADEVITVLLGI